MRISTFVILPRGVRKADDLMEPRFRDGRWLRRVHVHGDAKPQWVDEAQCGGLEHSARERWRRAKAHRDAVRAGGGRDITVIQALIELSALRGAT